MWQGLTSIESIPRVGPQHVGGWLFISGKRVWGAHVAGCCMRDVVHLVHPQEGLIWAQGGKSRTAVTPGEARPEARPLPSRGARKGPGQGSGTSCPTIWYRTCVCVCVCVCVCLVVQLCLTLQSFGLWPSRLLCLWDSPGKTTGVGYNFLHQGIFPTQGLNLYLLCFLHCRHILYLLRHQGGQILHRMCPIPACLSRAPTTCGFSCLSPLDPLHQPHGWHAPQFCVNWKKPPLVQNVLLPPARNLSLEVCSV